MTLTEDAAAADDEKGDNNRRQCPSPIWSIADGGAKTLGRGGGGRRPEESPLKFVEAKGDGDSVISSCCRDRPGRLEDAGRDRFPPTMMKRRWKKQNGWKGGKCERQLQRRVFPS